MKKWKFVWIATAVSCLLCGEVRAESLSLSKPDSINTTGSTVQSYDVASDTYDVEFAGWKKAEMRLRYSPKLDISSFDYLSMKFQAITAESMSLNGAFRLTMLDSRWHDGASQEVQLSNDILSGEEMTITIPLSDFDNGVFNFSDLTDLIIQSRGGKDMYAHVKITDLKLVTQDEKVPDQDDAILLPEPYYIYVSNGSTYQYLDPMRETMLIQLKGWGEPNTRFRYNPVIDLSEDKYLKIVIKVENLQGVVDDQALQLYFYDHRWTGGVSNVVKLPVSTLTGDTVRLYIPLADFDNGNFLFEHMNDLIIKLTGVGEIAGDITILELATSTISLGDAVIEGGTDSGTDEPTDVISVYLNNPSGVVASGGNEITFTESGFDLGLYGWSNSEVRFRYSPEVDLSGHSDLKVVMQVSNIQGNLDTSNMTIQFYDNYWSDGASNEISIPSSAFSGDQVTLKLPMSEFLNGTFNPAMMKDLFLRYKAVDGSGEFSADIKFLEFGLIGDSGTDSGDSGTGDSGDGDSGDTSANTSHGKAFLVTNKIIGMELDGNINLDSVMNTSNWIISSVSDSSFGEISPDKISREAAVLDAEDRDKNGQTLEDIVLRHKIYLELPVELSNDQVYKIETLSSVGTPYIYDGANGTFASEEEKFGPFEITVGQDNGAAHAIKLNQHGYSIKSNERYAYIGYWLGDGGGLQLPNSLAFKVFRKSDGTEVLSGMTEDRGFDPYSGEQVHQMDISSLEEGAYFIDVEMIGRSHILRVGKGSAYEAFYTAARGLFHQRTGVALAADNTHWSHDTCHRNAYKVDVLEDWGKDFPSNTPKENMIELPGGWYDAGDFDRRPVHLSVVENLLILAEMFPDKMSDGDLNLPESGNGIPDVVDEAMFGIRFWEALQNPDGGVRAGTQSYGHPTHIHCEDDTMPYWTYSANRYTSYKFAGAAAQASRVLSKLGKSQRASELLYKAELAWEYAEAQTEPGTTSPVNRTYEQKVKELMRERLHAAGELFATSGDILYQDAFSQNWPDMRGPTHYNSVTSLWGMAVAKSGSVDTNLRADVRQRIAESADQFIGYISENTYRNSRNPGYHIAWGTGTNAVAFVTPAILAYHFNPDPRYITAVALNADFQLGAHPMGQSWITGLGYETPEVPLHLNSMYDSLDAPVPGLPINGPFQNTRGYPCLPEDYWQCMVYNGFYPIATTDLNTTPTPFYHHYAPWARMAPMNEFTVWTDMNYTSLAYGFLYGVSEESPRDLHMITPNEYPLNAVSVTE